MYMFFFFFLLLFFDIPPLTLILVSTNLGSNCMYLIRVEMENKIEKTCNIFIHFIIFFQLRSVSDKDLNQIVCFLFLEVVFLNFVFFFFSFKKCSNLSTFNTCINVFFVFFTIMLYSISQFSSLKYLLYSLYFNELFKGFVHYAND